MSRCETCAERTLDVEVCFRSETPQEGFEVLTRFHMCKECRRTSKDVVTTPYPDIPTIQIETLHPDMLDGCDVCEARFCTEERKGYRGRVRKCPICRGSEDMWKKVQKVFPPLTGKKR